MVPAVRAITLAVFLSAGMAASVTHGAGAGARAETAEADATAPVDSGDNAARGSAGGVVPAAADSAPRSDTVSRIADFIRPVVRPGGGAYVLLPKVTYSSEAGWGVGAEVGRAFQWGRLYEADSDLRLDGRVTFEGDGRAGVTLNLGWLDRKYTFKTKFEYDDIPRSYYGIGGDTPIENREVYQRQSLLYYLEVFRRVTLHFRVGARGELEDSRMLEMEPGGQLASGGVPGAGKGAVAGGGLLATWDSRDRRYSPRSGALHQLFWMRFGAIDGGDAEFNVFNVDLRWFLPVGATDVLALQLFSYATDERPPFWRMAEIGGRGHSRGYRRGRFRDEVMAAAQAEYRLQAFWRVAFAGFGGVATAAPRMDQLHIHDLHPTVGIGLRFLLGKNGAHARFDAAYGDSFRLYLRLDEAF